MTYTEAIGADRAYRDALERFYGKAKAAEARYWQTWEHPKYIRELAQAKVDADEAWRLELFRFDKAEVAERYKAETA